MCTYTKKIIFSLIIFLFTSTSSVVGFYESPYRIGAEKDAELITAFNSLITDKFSGNIDKLKLLSAGILTIIDKRRYNIRTSSILNAVHNTILHEIYAIEAFTYDDVHADNKLYLIGERVFYVYDITTPTYIYIPEKPERMQVFCNAANSTRCIYRIGNEFYLFDRVHPRKIDIEDRLVQGIDSDLYDTNENENCVFSSLCAEEKDAT